MCTLKSTYLKSTPLTVEGVELTENTQSRRFSGKVNTNAIKKFCCYDQAAKCLEQ